VLALAGQTALLTVKSLHFKEGRNEKEVSSTVGSLHDVGRFGGV
jgi:hypothetical protein